MDPHGNRDSISVTTPGPEWTRGQGEVLRLAPTDDTNWHHLVRMGPKPSEHRDFMYFSYLKNIGNNILPKI